jgi:hypothetical protein
LACGTRILRVIHGRDTRATFNLNQHHQVEMFDIVDAFEYRAARSRNTSMNRGPTMSLNKIQKPVLLSCAVLFFLMTTCVGASGPAVPNPILYMTGTELFQMGGKQFVRYSYDVLNKSDYPAEMFTASPNLPPCGLNTKASRTWVDLYAQDGKRLYGFCALAKTTDLGRIWFALEVGVVPPSYIYIELTDRLTNTKYKSNLADTTL